MYIPHSRWASRDWKEVKDEPNANDPDKLTWKERAMQVFNMNQTDKSIYLESNLLDISGCPFSMQFVSFHLVAS